MRLRRLLAAIPLLLVTAPLTAQQAMGRIVGRVVESELGAPLAGAQIEIPGTAIRTTSALDGRYALTRVPAGTVSIAVRLIGFQPKTVTGIAVTAGAIVEQNVALASHVVELQEVTVSAGAERGTVARALDEQRNATGIVNTITSEQIERSPDSDAGQAVQRVSGVTVQDGKYVYVRGLGERYTTTSLNGSRIPSPEPERKIVPLDLFPSSLLEGITTSKTFTPDQPGDFSGAQVNLKTREFSAGRVLTLSVSGGYNTRATFKNQVSAPSGGGDWFALGGSDRKLPQIVRNAGNLSGITTQQQVNELVGAFRNVWSAESGRAAPNGGMGVAIGGEDPLFGHLTNYLFSFNYSNSFETRQEEQRGLAQGDTTLTVPFNSYVGETGRRSVLWGGLANLSTRLGSHTKLSLDNTFTRSADNEAQVLTGENEEFSQFNPLFITRLVYTERSVRSNQFHAEHLLSGRSLLDWSVTNAGVRRYEPDRSDLTYQGADAGGAITPLLWPGGARFATRTFSDLKEHSWNFAGNYQLTLGDFSRPSMVKIGGLFRTTSRVADTRAYNIVNNTLSDGQRTATPEQLFSPENIANSSFLINASTNAGRYTADEKIGAGYGMVDVPLGARLRVVAGARVERWQLDVVTTGVSGTQTPARPRATDILPSLAITATLSETQQLRLSGTQTLSRPEYRELSPVPYFEQIGLLTTIGNPSLKRALIRNADLRWEWYPKLGEIVSIGGFYKRFTDPIEQIIVLSAGTYSLGYVNAEKGDNYGVEVEVRKGLGASDGYAPVTLFANGTLMRSTITAGDSGFAALTRSDRPMVGQAPYVVNGGVTFAAGGFSATALYNVSGRRILQAGAGGLPDAYEEARHQVDATLQIPLGDAATLRLDGKNLLDAPYRLTQGQVLRQRYRSGRVFAFGFSWRP